MTLRRHGCPRCRGDQHLTQGRPAAWQCIQCGYSQPQGINNEKAAWQRLLDELTDLTEP